MLKHCNFFNGKGMTMKSIKLLTTSFGLVLALSSGFAVAQEKDEHKLQPKHGGVVVEANHIEYELVVRSENVQLHANDHGKVIDLSKAKAKVVFLVADQKMERTLAGQGVLLSGEGVDLKGSGYTAVATVEFANKKKATVRFKTN
jgi:hypothetical protein